MFVFLWNALERTPESNREIEHLRSQVVDFGLGLVGTHQHTPESRPTAPAPLTRLPTHRHPHLPHPHPARPSRKPAAQGGHDWQRLRPNPNSTSTAVGAQSAQIELGFGAALRAPRLCYRPRTASESDPDDPGRCRGGEARGRAEWGA